MLNRRTDQYFSALVDIAAGSCFVRGRFWTEVKAKSFDYAFARMVRASENAGSLNAVKEYYDEHFRDS